MTSLIRLTEQHNALYARVDKIEKFQENRKQATDPVIQRGQTYMNLASLVGSIVVLVGGSFIAWLVGHVEAAEKDIRSHETRIAVIENRNVSTKSSR